MRVSDAEGNILFVCENHARDPNAGFVFPGASAKGEQPRGKPTSSSSSPINDTVTTTSLSTVTNGSPMYAAIPSSNSLLSPTAATSVSNATDMVTPISSLSTDPRTGPQVQLAPIRPYHNVVVGSTIIPVSSMPPSTDSTLSNSALDLLHHLVQENVAVRQQLQTLNTQIERGQHVAVKESSCCHCNIA